MHDTQKTGLLKNRRIFIVEDSVANRIVFQMSLIKHGAVIDFERSGRDTLFRLRGVSHVDLIILDLMLQHGLTGFDLYTDIRALPKYDRVPIIAVSAMDPQVAVPRTQALGFNGFIAKPIDSGLFPLQIAQILDGEVIWHMGDRA